MRELSGSQARQAIDAEQVFATWREADRALRDRFVGSMEWKSVKGAALPVPQDRWALAQPGTGERRDAAELQALPRRTRGGEGAGGLAQARAVLRMLAVHLPHMRLDDPALAALPEALRTRGIAEAEAFAGRDTSGDW